MQLMDVYTEHMLFICAGAHAIIASQYQQLGNLFSVNKLTNQKWIDQTPD